MNDKPTLADLEALKNRIEGDVRRSRMQDTDGLSQHSPLMRNYRQVQLDIANFPKEAAVTETVKLDEKKIVVGSLDHMRHSVHLFHSRGYRGGTDGFGAEFAPDYHIHPMHSESAEQSANPLAPSIHNPIQHYIVVHKHATEDGKREAHHFSVQAKSAKTKGDTHSLHFDVKHHGKVM